MFDAFISYARKYEEFASRLRQALMGYGLETWQDVENIPPGHPDWESVVHAGIESAHCFIFIISPESLSSQPCLAELQYALQNKKRLISLQYREVDKSIIPIELRIPNWIDFRNNAEFEQRAQQLSEAIKTNYEWTEDHTRLLERAKEWERRGFSASLVLRGESLKRAEEWVTQANRYDEPQPTDLQTRFIIASRRAETRRQRVFLVAVATALVIVSILAGAFFYQSNVAQNEANARATEVVVRTTAQAKAVAEADMRATEVIIRTTAEANAITEAHTRATAQAVAEHEARISHAKELAARAVAAKETFMQRSLLLAVEAVRTTLDKGDAVVPEAEQALRDVLSQETGYLVCDAGRGQISPDSRWLVTVGCDGNGARLWDLRASDPTTAFFDVALQFTGYAQFTADSHWLILGDERQITLWDLATSQPATSPFPRQAISLASQYLVYAAPTDHWLATEDQQQLKLWSLTHPDARSVPLEFPNQDFVALSRDGKYLITKGLNQAVTLWQLDASHMISQSLRLLQDDIRAEYNGFEFSPDSRWLFGITKFADKQYLVRLWDLHAPPSVQPVILNRSGTTYPKGLFSPDSHWLIVGSWENGAYEGANPIDVWALSQSRVSPNPTYLLALEDNVQLAEFTPDSRWLITTDRFATDRATTRLWALGSLSGTQAITLGLPIEYAAISPDSRWLAAMQYFDTPVWDLKNPTSLPRRLPAETNRTADYNWTRTVLFSPDSRWLIGYNQGNHIIRLWSLTGSTPSEESIALRGYDDGISAEISSDSRWLLSTSREAGVRLWSIDVEARSNSSEPFALHGNEHGITAMAVSDNGQWLANGNFDGTVYLWQMGKLKEPPRVLKGSGNQSGPPQSAQINAVAFSPDNRWLAAGGDDTNIYLWNLTPAPITSTAMTLGGHTKPVRVLAFSADGQWLASGDDAGTSRLWDMSESDPSTNPLTARMHAPTIFGGITAIVFSRNGQWHATGGTDGLTMLYDMRRHPPQGIPLKRPGRSESTVNAILFSPDNRWLAVAGGDYKICIWDLKNLYEQPTVIGDQGSLVSFYTSGLNMTASAFSPDSQWLAAGGVDARGSGSTENTLHVWRVEDLYEEPIFLRGHEDRVTVVRISSDGRWLGTGGENGEVLLWNMQDLYALPILLAGHQHTVKDLAFTPDAHWLITTDYAVNRVWNLHTGELIDQACQAAGRNFTRFEWEQVFPRESYRQTCPDFPTHPTVTSK